MPAIRLVDKQNVLMELKGTTQTEVVNEMASQLYKNNFLSQTNQFVKDVLKREEYTTTGIGQGIAIPHGKDETVLKSTVIIGRSSHGIEWNSLDGKPVFNIFMMAIKANDPADVHLHQLAILSEKMMDDAFVAHFKAAKTVDELVSVINGSD